MSAKLLYATESYSSDFTIDIKEKTNCKGIAYLEVKTHVNSIPLIIKDGTEQVITFLNPLIIPMASHPITNGVFKFEFKQNTLRKNAIQKAVVRIIYFD